MCLILYLGARRELLLRDGPFLNLQTLSDKAVNVRQHVQTEYVYFVGAYTGCSCGFPSVVAEELIEDGMFDDDDFERAEKLQSVRELFALIDEALNGQPECVLFPVWDGSEGGPPKGDVRWHRESMSPDCFVLTERFRYTIVSPLKSSGIPHG